MTPKEKAEELVGKFYIVESPCFNGNTIDLEHIGFYSAAKCALIAVDEILSMGIIGESREWNMAKPYWQEVKQEIKNL